jgi:hypothetical protein
MKLSLDHCSSLFQPHCGIRFQLYSKEPAISRIVVGDYHEIFGAFKSRRDVVVKYQHARVRHRQGRTAAVEVDMYEVESCFGSRLRFVIWYCMLLVICVWLAKQFLIVRQLDLAAIRG